MTKPLQFPTTEPVAVVHHLGTPGVAAHKVGDMTLRQAIARFVGQHERGWGRADEALVRRLVSEGGRFGHHLFEPLVAAD